MAGATHPFFGNQYTDGGYKVGSFKFPEGLERDVGERLAKITTLNTLTTNTRTIPSSRNSIPVESAIRARAKSNWIIPTIIIAVVFGGGCLAYRYFKKKGIVEISNIGICTHCAEPLTGAKLIPDNDKSYIVCKKCDEKNYAHYHDGKPNSKTEEL